MTEVRPHAMNAALVCLLGIVVLAAYAGSADAQLWTSVQDGEAFAGAQIVHVIVDYGDETAEAAGEPDVTVNSHTLRMVQVTDGRWHAYFAASGAARVADATVSAAGNGLDFGTLCDSDGSANVLLGAVTETPQDYFADTDGVAFPLGGECDATYGDQPRVMAVLRSSRSANVFGGIGQSIDAVDPARSAQKVWPFIQLYGLGSGVSVNHDGQSVQIEYGSISDYARLLLDRASYPPGADIHIEIANTLLNVDPTDEDSWTWDLDGSGKGRVIYRAFDARGEPTGNSADISGSFGALECEDTCSLDIEFGGGAIEAVANGNGGTSLSGAQNDGLITLAETGANTGIFVSYDSGNESSLRVSVDAPRGTVLDIKYADSQSVTIGNSDAALEFGDGGTWSSGTRAPVTLHDEDANRNSRQKESIEVADPGAGIPTIVTGSPLTLKDAVVIAGIGRDGSLAGSARAEIDHNGARALYTPDAEFDSIVVDFGSMRDGMDLSARVDSLLNYDMRSLGRGTIDIHVIAGNTPLTSAGSLTYDTMVPVKVRAAAHGLVAIPEAVIDVIVTHEYAGLVFDMSGTLEPQGTLPLVADIVSYGTADDGASVYNQVIRLELEETGVDTGTFVGTLEYMLAGGGIVPNAKVYRDLATISDRATMLAGGDGSDVTLDYLDRAGDGSRRTVSGVATPASHTGMIFFDQTEYETSDIVLVTLYDADLNTNAATRESYPVARSGGGLLLLTLDEIVWEEHAGCDAPGPDLQLVETSVSSGVFEGELYIPQLWCDGKSQTPRNVAGTKIGITYADGASSDGYSGSASFEPGDGPPAPVFPLEIESVRFDADGGRIDATVRATADVPFEFIVQMTGADGTVSGIASQDVSGAEGVTQIRIEWDHVAEGSYILEAFAWRDGFVLAEPYMFKEPSSR